MKTGIDRRSFLRHITAGGATLALPVSRAQTGVPSYLKGYEAVYARNPKEAAITWFRDAKFGLFIHYGLYSLLEKGEWIQFHDRIPIKEYAKLAAKFDATRFDAGFLCDLAVEAGMKYVNLVAKHCDSFALWPTRQSDFHIMNSPARRDLVKEMAEACRSRGLGFFPFYEHGFDWRHPHGPAPWLFKSPAARPAYDPPDPWYASQDEHDFSRYVAYANAQIEELLTGCGPVAGVWLDGIGIPLSGDASLYRCPELYRRIRELQPQALISYKYGLTGEEDFFAPEDGQLKFMQGKESAAKPVEICACLQRRAEGENRRYAIWGYNRYCAHKSADEVWEDLKMAARWKGNLLLNIGPLPDGSVHPDDVKTLRAVGRRLQQDGFPKA